MRAVRAGGWRAGRRRDKGPPHAGHAKVECASVTLSSIPFARLDPSIIGHVVKRSRHTCSPTHGAILVSLMSGRIWAVGALCSFFALLHCGGSVQVISGDEGGRGGTAGSAGRGHAGAGHAGRGPSGAGGGGATSVDAGFDVYVDPGCPDAGPPVQVMACDAFSSTPNCPFGQGCFPFVDHPFGQGCDAQTFGTECRPAGAGVQGDTCGSADESCASGFVCVVGSQPGKHCVQLCPINGQKVCPAGMICSELDVEGFGVCS